MINKTYKILTLLEQFTIIYNKKNAINYFTGIFSFSPPIDFILIIIALILMASILVVLIAIFLVLGRLCSRLFPDG
jgi:hypothetical protein